MFAFLVIFFLLHGSPPPSPAQELVSGASSTSRPTGEEKLRGGGLAGGTRRDALAGELPSFLVLLLLHLRVFHRRHGGALGGFMESLRSRERSAETRRLPNPDLTSKWSFFVRGSFTCRGDRSASVAKPSSGDGGSSSRTSRRRKVKLAVAMETGNADAPRAASRSSGLVRSVISLIGDRYFPTL